MTPLYYMHAYYHKCKHIVKWNVISISIRRKALRGKFASELQELFLFRPDPMITILSGLELGVEISAFGIGEEGGVLLSGHIEVLIDLFTCLNSSSSTCCSAA